MAKTRHEHSIFIKRKGVSDEQLSNVSFGQLCW